LELAVFARFYTFHAVVIATVGILIYEASVPTRSTALRTSMGLIALCLTVIGLHLQETSIIAAGAFVAGLAAVLIFDRWTSVSTFISRFPLRIAIAALLLVAAACLAAHILGLTERLGSAPRWASYNAHRPQYYLLGFSESMPLFWPLFPFMALAAWYFHKRLTLFCLTMFAATFIVHSIAAQKSVRYIYYALPFFSTIWGCGIAGVCFYAAKLPLGPRVSQGVRYALVLLGIAFMLIISLEGQKALKTAAGKLRPIDVLSYAVEADWKEAVPTLQPLAASAAKLITSNAMKSIFYLGSYDYELNASIVDETDSGQEFGKDERTGRQAIGTADSVQKVLSMPGRTLIVLEQETLHLDSGVSTAALGVIESECKSVALPASAALAAWTCDDATLPAG
jgi:hypothetical protein